MRTVLGYTLTEIVRRRLLTVTLPLTGVFFGLFWLLITRTTFTASSPFTLSSTIVHHVAALGAILFGSFFVYAMVAVFSVFLVAGSLAGEVENGLLYAWVPRLPHRYQVLWGKWSAYAAISAAYALILFGGIVLLAGLRYHALPPLGNVVNAALLFALEGLTVTALGMLGSIWLTPLANGIVLTGLFFIAFFSGAVAVMGHFGHTALWQDINGVVSLLYPADSLYRRAAYEVSGPLGGLLAQTLGPMSAAKAPAGAFVDYAGAYVIGILALASWIWERRDL